MLLSEQRPLTDPLVLKMDSNDEDMSFIKSKSRRQVSPTRSVFVVLDDENDDDDERLNRRKSRLLEPHPVSVNSPSINTSSAKRRDAAAPRGISQAQIGEHYGNCIRLAAENKITAKNAFNLHLIDYMSDMLKKEDYTSFQIASSSLDAGAKIYAGRVDAVHQETYQVLTGLGRSDKPQAIGDEDENSGTEDPGELGGTTAAVGKESRKKTQVHRDIIQKQLGKIRSKVLAAKGDVDPLFQHQTSAYDEGGSAELRLNQLSTLDEACVLILDSSTRIMRGADKISSSTINMTGILDYLSALSPKNINQLTMCTSLQNFRFTNWDKNQDSDLSSIAPHEKSVAAVDNFDAVDDGDHFGNYAANTDDENDVTLTEGAPEPDEHIIQCGSSAAAATGTVPPVSLAEHDRDDSSNCSTQRTGTDGELFVSSLKSMLDKQYEHFGQLNDHLLGMWAGPEHWRKKAKRRRFNPITGREEDLITDDDVHGNNGTEVDDVLIDKSRKASRSKKEKATKLMYSDALAAGENKTRNGHLTRREWSKGILSEGVPNSAAANATVFKEQYRQKVGRHSNLLPSELSDSRQNLYRLFNREVILDTSRMISNGKSKDDTLQTELAHTNPDLCPIIDWIDGAAPGDSAREAIPLNDQVEDDMDDAPHICIDEEDDDIAFPFEGAFSQPTTIPFTEYGAHNDLELISQPRKVARIEIGYARTAKMINIRHLKMAMWSFLEDSLPPMTNPASRSPYSVASTSSAPEPPSLAGDPVSDPAVIPPIATGSLEDFPTTDKAGSHVPGACSFSELIDSLSNRISWQMAKELSISIALNCLLHLSNEKQLFLESSENMSDIFISQGLPQFEVEKLSMYTSETAQDDHEANGSAKRPQHSNTGRLAKAKRPRSSTLDSWLVNSHDESI